MVGNRSLSLPYRMFRRQEGAIKYVEFEKGQRHEQVPESHIMAQRRLREFK